MSEEEFECIGNYTVKDDDSIVSDNFKGEMLLRDGYRKKGNRRIMSTMKATFPYPFKEEERNYIGDRKAILLQKFYREATAEIIQERNRPPPVEEYCTEYDGNYNNECNHVEDMKQKNLDEKFPLYTSPAVSYWNFQIENSQGDKISLPGLTRSVDLKNPFKRNSGFTKPISEVLDDCEL